MLKKKIVAVLCAASMLASVSVGNVWALDEIPSETAPSISDTEISSDTSSDVSSLEDMTFDEILDILDGYVDNLIYKCGGIMIDQETGHVQLYITDDSFMTETPELEEIKQAIIDSGMVSFEEATYSYADYYSIADLLIPVAEDYGIIAMDTADMLGLWDPSVEPNHLAIIFKDEATLDANADQVWDYLYEQTSGELDPELFAWYYNEETPEPEPEPTPDPDPEPTTDPEPTENPDGGQGGSNEQTNVPEKTNPGMGV